MLIILGVVGLKGTSRRSPTKAKKMYKRAVCLVVAILVITVIGMLVPLVSSVSMSDDENWGDDEEWGPNGDEWMGCRGDCVWVD